MKGVSLTQVRELIYGVWPEESESGKIYEWLNLPSEPQEPSAFVSPDDYEALWQLMVSRTGREDLGLLVAQKSNLGMLGMLSHLIQVSPNPLTGMELTATYNHQITDTLRFSVYPFLANYAFELEPSYAFRSLYPLACQKYLEYFSASLVLQFGGLLRRFLQPIRVEFTFDMPPYSQDFYRFFQAPVIFNAPANRLVFSKKDLETPLPGNNPTLFRHLEGVLQELIQLGNHRKSTSETVRELVFNGMNGNRLLAIEEVADQLGISTRTLQRKLDAEGSSFSDITEFVRREVSLKLLEKRQHSVKEIAYLLGYEEPGSFRRAFKKWTGENPKAYSA